MSSAPTSLRPGESCSKLASPSAGAHGPGRRHARRAARRENTVGAPGRRAGRRRTCGQSQRRRDAGRPDRGVGAPAAGGDVTMRTLVGGLCARVERVARSVVGETNAERKRRICRMPPEQLDVQILRSCRPSPLAIRFGYGASCSWTARPK